jgi:hypothetical protein
MICTGTGGTFTDMAIYDDDSTRRIGLFMPASGSFKWKGQIQFGTASLSTTFSDSNRNITLDDTPRVASGFNKWYSAHASNSVTLTNISVSGRALSITGSAPVSRGDFDFNLGTHVQDGCTFTDVGTFGYNGSATLTGNTYRRCGTVTTGSTLDGCQLLSSYALTAVSTTSLNKVSDCSFVSSGTGHAVDLTSAGALTTQTMNWNSAFSGYGADGTTNAVIKVNVASGNTLTVNSSSGTPTYLNVGTGTVVIAANQVTLNIYVKTIAGTPIENAMVYVTAGAGGGLTEGTVIIDKVLTDSSGLVSDTRSLSANQPIVGRVRKSTSSPFYQTANIVGTISNTAGLDLTIQMIKDE